MLKKENRDLPALEKKWIFSSFYNSRWCYLYDLECS